MKKKYLAASFSVLACVNSISSEAALSSSALLAFDPGIPVFNSINYQTTVTQGSYFGIDLNADGVVAPSERLAIMPGSDGGLLIGQSQLGNSHSGPPNGSEIAPIDAPWSFLASTGVHQSTSPVNIISDDGSGTVELDFSGWGATWNNIPNINLGGDSANFASDTGIALLSCTVDCSNGDVFTLDYAAHVALNDPSGLGGILWAFHIEGVVASTVPLPASVWLFVSGLIGLIGAARKKTHEEYLSN